MTDRDDIIDATAERVRAIHPVGAAEALTDAPLWDGIGPAMTCGEAELLGALLYSHGVDLPRVVELIVDLHGQQDDEGDDHCVENEEERDG